MERPKNGTVVNPVTPSDSSTRTIQPKHNQQCVQIPKHAASIQYYHAVIGFPTKATWLKAINARFFATWPMLTAKAVAQYFPDSDKTQKRHMLQQRQGVHSAQEKDEVDDKHIAHATKLRSREISVNINNMQIIMYTGQMGNRYIMVLCKWDGNLILVNPMKI